MILPAIVVASIGAAWALGALVWPRRQAVRRDGCGTSFPAWLAGMGVAAVIAFLLVGTDAAGGDATGLVIASIVPIGVLAWALARRMPHIHVSHDAWLPMSDVTAVTDNVLERVSPSATAVALARVEGRHLSVMPWFGAGVGFLVVMILVFGLLFGDENHQSRAEMAQMVPWFVHPFVGMVVIGLHRATTRPERDGTRELYETCPVSVTTRTAGLLGVAWLPTATLVVFLGVLHVALSAWAALHGPLVGDNAGDLVGAVVLGSGGVALGVALGRWARVGLAPLVAVVAVGFVAVGLNGVGGRGWNPLVGLSTAPSIEGPSPVFTDRHVWSHVAWIVGLTIVVSTIAMARDRRDRRIVLLLSGAVLVSTVAGVATTRPMPASSAERIASYVAFPERVQQCATASSRVSVCVFDLHAALLDDIVAEIVPVAVALPSSPDAMTIRQVYGRDLAQLPPEVRDELPRRVPQRPSGEVALASLDDALDPVIGVRYDLALAAVGLPTTAGPDLMPVVVAGQARGVVAIWLASRGLTRGELRSATTSAVPASSDAFQRGSLELVGECSVPSVVWSAQDLEAARAILALPASEFERVIVGDWQRWVDPRTGTNELLAALELPLFESFDDVRARPGNTC